MTIEVKRIRESVTQGSATIYINGKEVITFRDDMYLDNGDGTFTSAFKTVKNVHHYGKVIQGWGSIIPDSNFILCLLNQYPEIAKKAILEVESTENCLRE